ncbi:MAG TPA: hypothetical protein VMW63_04605 [Methanoregulaceae archaeon]|nr:hypothetical protein [Methanoregulaceae archaeon]
MAAPHPVPDDMKWQIASRLASCLPVLYDITFRDAVGEDYDLLEQQIWIYVGQEANSVVSSYHLPTGNAEELARALDLVATVFFGPEMRAEQVKITAERSVLVLKRCPFVTKGLEVQAPGEHLFQRCMAFAITAVEAMNPDYTLRFVRSMCMGDGHCEMKVVRKDEVSKEEKK